MADPTKDLNKCYLDIEATGLDKNNDMPTVVGILANNEFKQFVSGFNLTGENIDNFLYEKGITEVVGYNHTRYDLPLLKFNPYTKCKAFDEMIKLDLMDIAHHFEIYGGLKRTEEKLGIQRNIELNFEQQIELWNDWIYNSNMSSLSKYLSYNRDDVINLKKLEEKLIEYI